MDDIEKDIEFALLVESEYKDGNTVLDVANKLGIDPQDVWYNLELAEQYRRKNKEYLDGYSSKVNQGCS